MGKKAVKRLTPSQAEFLGFKSKPRYSSDNTRRRYSLSKKQLKKLQRYDELDAKGKVMVYDIETSQVRADVWWTGKQYIRHSQLVDGPEGETRIISIAWKYVGEDKVYDLTWDDGDDKEMMQEFMAKADPSTNPMAGLPYDPAKYGQNKMGSGAGPAPPFRH